MGDAGDTTIAMIPIAKELMVTTLPAKPSMPSIKLIALEIPTIQRRVMG